MEKSVHNNEIEELLTKIKDLKMELDQANMTKIQSDQYYFDLVKENTQLSEKYTELKNLYENSLHELEITQETLMKMEITRKITTEEVIRLEESLLNESNALEISFHFQIQEIEGELNQLRRELKSVKHERNELIQNNLAILQKQSNIEADKTKLKLELKEIKQSEDILLKKYSHLEKEYDLLQKQVSYLKSCKSELSTSKIEIKALLTQNSSLQSQLEEINYLNTLSKQQIEELKELLQYEREDKVILKKELDMYKNPDSLSNITTNLAESIKYVEERDSCNSEDDNKKLLLSIGEEKNVNNMNAEKLSEILRQIKLITSQIISIKIGENMDNIERNNCQIILENSQNELKNFIAQLSSLTFQNDELKNVFRCSLKRHSSYKRNFQNISLKRHSSCKNNSQNVILPEINSSKIHSFSLTNSVPDILNNHKTKISISKDRSKSEAIILENNLFNKSKKFFSPNQSLTKSLTQDVDPLSIISSTLDDEIEDEANELRKEIVFVKSLLSDGCDKILKRSHLFKSDKCNEYTEDSTSNIENDNLLKHDLIRVIRNEVTTLKQEVASYMKIAVFFKSKGEYLKQINDFHRQLDQLQEEKQRLTDLVKCADEEKAVLEDRFKNLEKEFQFVRRRKQKLIPRCWKVIMCCKGLPKKTN